METLGMRSRGFRNANNIWWLAAVVTVMGLFLIATIAVSTWRLITDADNISKMNNNMNSNLKFCPGQVCDSSATFVKEGDCFRCLYVHTDAIASGSLVATYNMLNINFVNVMLTMEELPNISPTFSIGHPDWKGLQRITMTGYLTFNIQMAGGPFGGAALLPSLEDIRLPGYALAQTLSPGGGAMSCFGSISDSNLNLVFASAFIGCDYDTFYPPCQLNFAGQSNANWTTELITCRIESTAINGNFNP